jgi:hypothetical protein
MRSPHKVGRAKKAPVPFPRRGFFDVQRSFFMLCERAFDNLT